MKGVKGYIYSHPESDLARLRAGFASTNSFVPSAFAQRGSCPIGFYPKSGSQLLALNNQPVANIFFE